MMSSMARPESRVGTTPEHHTEKRKHLLRFLAPALASVLLLTLLANACAPNADSIPSPTTSPAIASGYTDFQITSENPKIKSIAFGFDKDYAGGSINMTISFNDPGFYTIFASQIQPTPDAGTLVANSYLVAAGQSETRYPVIKVSLGEVDNVFIGTGQTPDKTYSAMQVYEITRTPTGISAIGKGVQKVDPATLKLRPPLKK